MLILYSSYISTGQSDAYFMNFALTCHHIIGNMKCFLKLIVLKLSMTIFKISFKGNWFSIQIHTLCQCFNRI